LHATHATHATMTPAHTTMFPAHAPMTSLHSAHATTLAHTPHAATGFLFGGRVGDMRIRAVAPDAGFGAVVAFNIRNAVVASVSTTMPSVNVMAGVDGFRPMFGMGSVRRMIHA
ncbi:MAG TPA: hypothetical protein VK852_08630, partial [Desulfobacterales bacterium]|nr:hypothetical protein [Desulfobacterales bacterium]